MICSCEVRGAIRRMVAALRPGGRLVVPTYCHDATAVSRCVSGGMSLVGFPGQRRLTLDGLAGLVTDAGLVLRQAELVPGLLPIGFVVVERP